MIATCKNDAVSPDYVCAHGENDEVDEDTTRASFSGRSSLLL